jgi:hypothetical protein
MTVKSSTGLRNALLATSTLRTALSLGSILIYSGAAPTSPNDAATGTLLCTISNASTATGLTMEATAVDGILAKAPSEVWSGVNAAGGVAGYYRHVAVGDTGVLSTTQVRIQGTVAVAGADMNFTSTTLANGATQTIDFYTVSLPEA